MVMTFVGQIEALPYSFAPKGWALCAGQTMAINQNAALFSLLGTTYGGNGVSTFLLPDLRGRVANGFGQGPGLSPYTQGQAAGEEMHTLLQAEVPPHSHAVNAVVNRTSGGTNIPGPSVVFGSAYAVETGNPPEQIYSAAAPTNGLGNVSTTGGQPHENRMPFLVVNYCIALSGIFPSRN
ncbi:MAG TPA: tail fiber protein [Aliidongia sp.]|nr:tail fiber protein [Aliidongia sp.]